MTGDRLPQPLTTDLRSTELVTEPSSTVNFNTALPLVEETNMTVGRCSNQICGFYRVSVTVSIKVRIRVRVKVMVSCSLRVRKVGYSGPWL